MSLRDFLWDYPVLLKRLYKALIPLSHIIFFTLISVIIFSLFFNPEIFNRLFPLKKDVFVEGVVGSSENLNPVFLTTNQVDRDLQSLIFTKLFNLDSQGFVKPSLAKTWSVSSDFKTYTVNINDNYYWQDGTKLTAEDVEFTFNFAKELYSKYAANTFGQGISTLSVIKTGEYSVKFVLSDVNATIFEMLSVYIVPKHILENTNLESFALTNFSKFPIGSGPYKVVSNDNLGVKLVKNDHYPLNIQIPNFQLKTFNSVSSLEDAFKANQLDGFGTYQKTDMSFLSEYSKKYVLKEFKLPFRKKIIFFNTRSPKFSSSAIRRGFLEIINKEEILENSKIDGTISKTSIPSSSWAYRTDLFTENTYNPQSAVSEFKTAGYVKNPVNNFYTSSDGKILSVNLTYLDNDVNKRLCEEFAKELENEGVLVNLVPKTYDQITRETLASRDFELILYELEVSIDPDQYNLWHSLKIDYPNLNISGFKNTRLDVYLERGRQLNDRNQRLENYVNIQKLMKNEVPVIFFYEPKYFYVLRNNVVNTNINEIKYPQDRFFNINQWSFN